MGFQLEVLSWPNSSMIPTMWPQVRNPALEKRTRTWEPYLDLSRSKCNRWEDGEGKQAFSVLIEPDTMETEIFCCLNSGSLHSGVLGQGQGGRAFLCDWAGEKRKRVFFSQGFSLHQVWIAVTNPAGHNVNFILLTQLSLLSEAQSRQKDTTTKCVWFFSGILH